MFNQIKKQSSDLFLSEKEILKGRKWTSKNEG